MSNRFSTVVDLLAVVVLLLAATAVVVVEPFGGGALRTALVLPILLFVPGYALVSFCYPDLPGDPATREREGWSLTSLERVGLAIAASVAIVPLITLVLNFTPMGIRARPVLGGVVIITSLLTLGALVRRFRLEPDRRFRAPVLSWIRSSLGTYLTRSRATGRQRTAFEAKTNGHRILNLLLVGAVLVLLASVAYAAAGPKLPSEDSTSTELYLLDGQGQYLLGTENDVSGGDSVPAVIAVENHENSEQTYTVVIERQQVVVGEDSTKIKAESTADTFQQTVADGETAKIPRTFQGGGENLRVQVMLFRGDAPTDPSGKNAYRVTRFWPAGNATGSEGN